MCGWFFGVVLLLSMASDSWAQKGKYVGKRWSWELLEKKQTVEEGTFRVSNFELFRADKKIGSFVYVDKQQIKITFVEGKLKGSVAELRLVKFEPPTYRGELKKGSADYRMKIVFLAD